MAVPPKMRAAVLYGPEDMRLEEIPTPRIGPGEVLIQVKACGICGTDPHIYHGRFPAPNLPLILGHEFAGQVLDIGSNVSDVSIGDRVTADINISCGNCYYCRQGQKLFCPDIRQLGVHTHGAFAEYLKVPAQVVYRLPADMTYEYGAYVEPLACAIHGQERTNIQLGSSLAIIGAGPMGLTHAILGRLRGASPIIISEINDARIKKAGQLGIDHVIDAKAVNPVEEVKRITDGRGADYVIEAVGSIPTYREAFQMVRRGGSITAFGAAPADVTIELKPFDIYSKELTIVGSYAGTYATWPEAIALISGRRFDPGKIISKTISLDQILEGIETAENNKDIVKIMVVPGG